MFIHPELIDELKKSKVILFVGAGVSVNLGLPSWGDLIEHMAVELDFDPATFRSYGDFLELAEYYEIKKGSIGPLRSWMDIQFHSPLIKIEESLIHKLIAKFNFHIIYTTNYDRWIERAFKAHGVEHVKVTNIYDLTKLRSGITQIIKFHGDFDDDSSIVLTESSYFNRLSFEGPLDMKLRSDILGKSILFIGYSLNDIDMRYLLYKLNKLWEGYSTESVRPRSYIFMLSHNPIKNEVFRERGVETIVADCDNPQRALEDFLCTITREVHGAT
ncbi:MAG: SIR2 family protein [Spirochaetes bacterium]|nr:SIR2 family protein [Spirochaetota bacterium]